jgi:hypothetical protein
MVGMLFDWEKAGVVITRTQRRINRDVTRAILNVDCLANRFRG